MKILGTVNPANISDGVANNYKTRLAARGVVFNQDNNVAILPVSNHNYYKLPGGGIDEGESEVEAFKRECLEEIGFDVEVVSELGLVVEYRSEYSKLQTSYCYIGKVIGERKETAFTEHEIEQGLKQPVWVPFDEALKLISTSSPDDYSGSFIKERDTIVMETAREIMLK